MTLVANELAKSKYIAYGAMFKTSVEVIQTTTVLLYDIFLSFLPFGPNPKACRVGAKYRRGMLLNCLEDISKLHGFFFR